MSNTGKDKITKAQIRKNMEKHLNREVIIMEGNHGIHLKKKGTAIRVDEIKHKLAMVVKMDTGEEVNIFNGTELFFITQKINVNDIQNN